MRVLSPGRNFKMIDAVNMLMLVCATVASLAFGVLAAYAACRAAFVLLRWHARSVAHAAPQATTQVSGIS